MKLTDKPIKPRPEYKLHPELIEQRPPTVGFCFESSVQQYMGTDIFQWWTSGPSPYWEPFGEPVLIAKKDQKRFEDEIL
jgi:hypothetical protein